MMKLDILTGKFPLTHESFYIKWTLFSQSLFNRQRVDEVETLAGWLEENVFPQLLQIRRHWLCLGVAPAATA